jgi:hypothetical protein
VRKPTVVYAGGMPIACLPARRPLALAVQLARLAPGAQIELLDGECYRVTTRLGSVCGETREDAIAGALARFDLT